MPWLAEISYTHVGTSRHPLKKGHHISFSHHHPESAHTPWPQGRSTAAQGMQNVFIQGLIFLSLGCQYPVTFQQPKNYLFLGTIFWTGSLSSTFAWFNFSDSVCLSPDPLQVLKSQFFPAFGKGWFFPSLKKSYEASNEPSFSIQNKQTKFVSFHTQLPPVFLEAGLLVCSHSRTGCLSSSSTHRVQAQDLQGWHEQASWQELLVRDEGNKAHMNLWNLFPAILCLVFGFSQV